MYCPACGHDKNPPGADACGNCGLALTHLDAPAANGPVEASLMNDPVSVLDPRPPLTVPVDATLGDAVRQMTAGRTGAVLVTGTAGELVGILTERDFLTKVAAGPGFESLPVREFMTPDPETVAPTDVLAYAIGKMDAGGYRHLPVVAAGKPVGVISVRDILRHLTTICPDG
jgi:CBS domain-containing protein